MLNYKELSQRMRLLRQQEKQSAVGSTGEEHEAGVQQRGSFWRMFGLIGAGVAHASLLLFFDFRSIDRSAQLDAYTGIFRKNA